MRKNYSSITVYVPQWKSLNVKGDIWKESLHNLKRDKKEFISYSVFFSKVWADEYVEMRKKAWEKLDFKWRVIKTELKVKK